MATTTQKPVRGEPGRDCKQRRPAHASPHRSPSLAGIHALESPAASCPGPRQGPPVRHHRRLPVGRHVLAALAPVPSAERRAAWAPGIPVLRPDSPCVPLPGRPLRYASTRRPPDCAPLVVRDPRLLLCSPVTSLALRAQRPDCKQRRPDAGRSVARAAPGSTVHIGQRIVPGRLRETPPTGQRKQRAALPASFRTALSLVLLALKPLASAGRATLQPYTPLRSTPLRSFLATLRSLRSVPVCCGRATALRSRLAIPGRPPWPGVPGGILAPPAPRTPSPPHRRPITARTPLPLIPHLRPAAGPVVPDPSALVEESSGCRGAHASASGYLARKTSPFVPQGSGRGRAVRGC